MNIENPIPEPAFREDEHRIIRRDGEVRLIHVRIGVVVKDGRIVKMYGANQDVTELRRTEAELRESEERFHMLAEMLPEAIYEVDLKGRFVYVNKRAMEAFLINEKDIEAGLTVVDLIMPADRARAASNSMRIIRGEHLGSNEYQARRKDGTSFPVMISSAPIFHNGNPIGMRGIVVDSTETKRVEAALQEANRKLNLLSSITRHDISNQVLGLEGNLALLENRHPEIAGDSFLKNSEKAARRIATMVQFTKSYEDIGVKAPSWHDVRDLIIESSREINLGELQLVNDVPAGLEIFADPLVVKVFHNLIDNAVRHGERATHVRFSLEAKDGNDAIVCEDDGKGIDAETREMLFTRGVGKDHGLGLFLSREILEITGIKLQEEGQEGKGARFVMTLPAGMHRRHEK
jgi:PAS domain S-box-containing protein